MQPDDPARSSPEPSLQRVAPGIHRPRYRPQSPLLWRGQGHLQVGEGTHHVLLTEVTESMVTWLIGLDGLRTMDQVAADLPIPTVDATRILRAAVRAVAIEDAAAMPDTWRWNSVQDRDASSTDRQAAASTYGSMAAADLAMDRRASARWFVRGTGWLADQARLALTVAGLPPAKSAAVAKVVVLADGQHPVGFTDPQVDLPHLPIGAYGDRAIAGPLVIPGQTSCLQCAYLHTRDADPHWPSLSLQLERSLDQLHEQPIDRLHALMVASLAATMIRNWVDAPHARTWRNRAVEIRLPDGTRTDHLRPVHPMCSCTWNPRTSAAAAFG